MAGVCSNAKAERPETKFSLVFSNEQNRIEWFPLRVGGGKKFKNKSWLGWMKKLC